MKVISGYETEPGNNIMYPILNHDNGASVMVQLCIYEIEGSWRKGWK